MKNETISAISTAMNEGGIGIIRISGKQAWKIADKVYRSKNENKKLIQQKSHTIHYGYIMDNEEIIDEVMVMLMKGPHSYTAEDTVEINCHGGIVVMRKILEIVIKNGAYPAEPGEFTKRAFLNGRIDLSQAEAVMDIIQAKNEYALKSSISQLKGSVQKAISELRAGIIYHIAYIESALDDPEHSDLTNYPEELAKCNQEWIDSIQKLIDSNDNGRVITEGIKTVIVGKPNAGKSSFLNTFVGEERAIVTDIEGTTRDILQETMNVNGIFLNLIDTAGIRDTDDIVEKIGVDKAKEYTKNADLIIYIVDSSRKLDENDEEIIKLIADKKVIVLLNKIDLKAVVTKEILKDKIKDSVILPVSAKENIGMESFEKTLKDMFFKGKISFNNQVYITNARHKRALMESLESLKQVQNSLEMQMPEDFYSIDLMSAYERLGFIIGESVEEDLVNEIFSKFCTGK